MPSDFDAGHHVPDQLEVDLRNAHAGVAPRTGKRQRHVRLGFAAEIDRPVIDLVRDGLGEFGLGGIVDAAADNVHGESRYTELFVARGVDLREFGNRRHLAQEPQGVEAALVERAVGPRQLRGPAHLALDLGDEFLDLVGGGLRLLVLYPDQGCLVLLIGKPDLEGAVGDQRHNDHGDEECDIFDEKAASHCRRAGARSGSAAGGGRFARRPGPIVDIRLHAKILHLPAGLFENSVDTGKAPSGRSDTAGTMPGAHTDEGFRHYRPLRTAGRDARFR